MTDSKPLSGKTWDFVHNLAVEAKWTPGLREIFEYRDLGIKDDGLAEDGTGRECQPATP